MVRIIRHFPASRPNDNGRNRLFDEEKPLYSVAAEDRFDDLLAGLIYRPEAAAPETAAPEEALPYVAPGDHASGDTAPHDVAPAEHARLRLPSVEEFQFDEAAARSMASKLAPANKSRAKKRRQRHRQLSRDRWRLGDDRDVGNETDEARSHGLQRATAGRRGSGRGLLWSFGASIVIVTGTSAAFGFVQPLNDLLPERMAAFLSDLSDDLGSSGGKLLRGADGSADYTVAGDTDVAGTTPVGPDQPMAKAAAAAVSAPPVAAEVRPSARRDVSTVVGQTEPSATASKQSYNLGFTVLELSTIDNGAVAEFATPETTATPETPATAETPTMAKTPTAQSPAIAQRAAPADGESQDKLQVAALRPTLKADRLAATEPPAAAEEPVATAPPAPAIKLSAAEIERLLERGHALLQRGDIASARLLFERVAAAGDRRGAKGMGMTYDPQVYARLPVAGVKPDREKAQFWYERAREAEPQQASPMFQTARSELPDAGGLPVPGSAEWNAACAGKYRSFEPSTGLYTAHSGVKRPCRLP